ncbi:MAG: rRNA maturation RNase YbeY [Candidatus Cloacimonetes bacterium]|nr:rRNA maturation RNase YbeY [Candidatus Cloacimonadota bacterium]
MVNETRTKIEPAILQEILQWMKTDLVFEAEATVCLKLSENAEIKEINQKYRGKNALTDVLSFPCQIPNIPFKGDIIINTAVADQQKGNHTLEKEIAILFIHGLLHLAGMDHIRKKDQAKMHLFELKYQDMLNKTHSLSET